MTALEVVISVTAADIAKGAKDSCGFCPIAIAATRATKKPALVGTAEIEIGRRGEYSMYPLPPEAVAFIERFDAGQKVEPFTFKLTTGQRCEACGAVVEELQQSVTRPGVTDASGVYRAAFVCDACLGDEDSDANDAVMMAMANASVDDDGGSQ